MTEIYLHIVARMADYMATHPYASQIVSNKSSQRDRAQVGPAEGAKEGD